MIAQVLVGVAAGNDVPGRRTPVAFAGLQGSGDIIPTEGVRAQFGTDAVGAVAGVGAATGERRGKTRVVLEVLPVELVQRQVGLFALDARG